MYWPARWQAIVAFVLVGQLLFGEANAQVRLPNIQVPQLPPIQLPIDPTGTVNTAAGQLDPSRLRDLRRLRVQELLRANRRELEADPSGAPIVRSEIAVYAPTETTLQMARSAGYDVIRETTLTGLDARIVILSPRRGQSTRAALRQLRSLDRGGSFDYNHVYIESGVVTSSPVTMLATTLQTDAAQSVRTKIGLIDTGIADVQPIFQDAQVTKFGCVKPAPAAHGTAVASLMVGHSAIFSGAAPNAMLFAADVYCGEPTGGSIEKIAAAFSWLNANRVAVINVSLVGPNNALLERIVATMLARGHVIVAAVGNDGPSAPALYPAAYPGVIGVTGVDAKRHVLVEAGRGKHVHFAAPGMDMGAAGMNGDYVAVRGTSFAAPIVAGLLAGRLTDPDVEKARGVLAEFDHEAIDLGSRGVDNVYGHGLLGEHVRVEPGLLAARRK
jgi:hypothetical protein